MLLILIFFLKLLNISVLGNVEQYKFTNITSIKLLKRFNNAYFQLWAINF